jgi:hypothetical protein
MTDDLDFDADLAFDLHHLATLTDLPRGDVDAVVRRGRRRTQRRRRTYVAVTSVVALVLGAAGIRIAGHDGGGTRTIEVTPAVAPHLGDTGIRWQRVNPSSALGFASEVAGTSELYALSTAPGQSGMQMAPRVVWRSADGVDWNAASTLGDDLYVADLAPTDQRVYAVGTGPATATTAGGDPVAGLLVGWSDDDAKTFAKQPLPIDLAQIASHAKNMYVQLTDIAASTRGVVATALVRADLDVPALLPAGVTAPNGWAVTANGVDLLDDGAACPPGTTDRPTARLKALERSGAGTPTDADAKNAAEARAADELRKSTATTTKPSANAGGAGPAPEQPQQVYPYACFAPDGTTVMYSPQERHGVVRSLTWDELGVRGDVRQAAVGQPFVFAAAPGSTDFTRVTLPDATGVQSMALRGDADGFDVIVTRASDGVGPKGADSQLVALHSTDGRSWTATGATPQGIDYVSAIGRVGGQLVVIGGGSEGGARLAVGGAGGTWTTTNLADLLPAGVRAGRSVESASAAVGPFGVVVSAVLFDKNPNAKADGGVAYQVLASRDLVTWSADDLAPIAGANVHPNRVLMVGDHVVILGTRPNPAQHRADTIAVVGTPE